MCTRSKADLHPFLACLIDLLDDEIAEKGQHGSRWRPTRRGLRHFMPAGRGANLQAPAGSRERRRAESEWDCLFDQSA